MRALLHNEVGLVAHRRAWASPGQPQASLLALYRTPHHVQNWDSALLQVGSLMLQQCMTRGRACAPCHQALAEPLASGHEQVMPGEQAGGCPQAAGTAPALRPPEHR